MSTPDFTGRAAPMNGPALRLVAVVPDDDADLGAGPTRSLYVGSAGRLVVVDVTGSAVTIVSGSHQYHPVQVRRVMKTGTTATAILALY